MRASELKPGEIGQTERGRLVRRSNGGDKLYAIDDAYLHIWHDYDVEVERLVPESKVADAEAAAHLWYDANGEPEMLATAEEVIKRRQAAAKRLAELEQQVTELAEQNAWLCEQYSGVIDTFTESLSKPTYPAELVIEHMRKWFDQKTEEDIAEAFEEFGGVEAVRKLADENAELTAKLEAVESGALPPLQINLGSGEWKVSAFFDHEGDGAGVLLAPAGGPHEVGDLTGEGPEQNYEPQPGEFYLHFANRESAMVVIESICCVVAHFCDTAPLPEPAEPEPPAKPDCLKGVPAVLCRDGVQDYYWLYGPVDPTGGYRAVAVYSGVWDWATVHPSDDLLIPLHNDPGAEELREQIEAARGGEA